MIFWKWKLCRASTQWCVCKFFFFLMVSEHVNLIHEWRPYGKIEKGTKSLHPNIQYSLRNTWFTYIVFIHDFGNRGKLLHEYPSTFINVKNMKLKWSLSEEEYLLPFSIGVDWCKDYRVEWLKKNLTHARLCQIIVGSQFQKLTSFCCFYLITGPQEIFTVFLKLP